MPKKRPPTLKGFGNWSRGPAAPAKSLLTGTIYPLQSNTTHKPNPHKPKPPVSSKAAAAEICIVQGAGAPGNLTGQRQVHIFPNLAATHAAGFTWAI